MYGTEVLKEAQPAIMPRGMGFSDTSNCTGVKCIELQGPSDPCESQPYRGHLTTQLQDGSRLTFSYISFLFFTFPDAPYRIFLLLLP